MTVSVGIAAYFLHMADNSNKLDGLDMPSGEEI